MNGECPVRTTNKHLNKFRGADYKFKSCAEVHVTEAVVEPVNRMCLNGGEWKNESGCACKTRTSGKFCQYKGLSLSNFSMLMTFSDDCERDADCLNTGKCLADGIYPNKKTCFCNYGYFGPTCQEGGWIDIKI